MKRERRRGEKRGRKRGGEEGTVRPRGRRVREGERVYGRIHQVS